MTVPVEFSVGVLRIIFNTRSDSATMFPGEHNSFSDRWIWDSCYAMKCVVYVTLYGLVEAHWCFWETYSLHLQVWKVKQHVATKNLGLFVGSTCRSSALLWNVTYISWAARNFIPEVEIFIFTAVKPSNSTPISFKSYLLWHNSK
jgi:hypothetical protein